MMAFVSVLHLLFTLPTIALVLAALGTGSVRRHLLKRQVMDIPSARSNHARPTPRGGGLATTGTLLLLFAAAPLILSSATEKPIALPHHAALLAAAALLMLVSWRDDLNPLPPLLRLAAQAIAVAIGLTALDAPVFSALLPLPLWLDYALTGLAWVWFINLFNFMDGIDGITAVESLFLCAGLWLLAFLTDYDDIYLIYSGIIAATMLGFLIWNWPPAKIFLGDVGSVPLGFLLGFLLLQAAAEGLGLSVLIISAYYLADSGITLIKRLIKREKLFEAHSQHYYQQAVRKGWSHRRVTALIAALNSLLLGLTLAMLFSVIPGWFALALAAGFTLCFLRLLAARKR